jgi:hypothetical protein
MGQDLVSTVDVLTLVFGLWPKISLWKEMYGKAHCHDAKSICLAKDLISLIECTAVNPRLNRTMLQRKIFVTSESAHSFPRFFFK